MNLKIVRENIKNKLGEKFHFRYRGVRNQVEEFDGTIIKCYSSIFIIKLENGDIKAFSYNDFIINNIKILY